MSALRKDYFSSLPYKIIQRKWLVITPLVVVMSLIFAYTRNVDLYRSSAIVTFHTEYMLADRDATIKNLFEEKVSAIVGSLKFGDSLRSITQKVWPDIDPASDPVAFNNRTQSLGSKSGIELSFRRDNYRALNIAYTSKDPDEAYRVVQATIDTLVDESKHRTERRVASSSTFMLREIEAYRVKLKELDQEIARLESGLGPLAASDDEGGEAVVRPGPLGKGEFADSLRYSESLPKLEFNLKVAEKELERLVERLESGAYVQEARKLEAMLPHSDDRVLAELRSAIADKEKQRNVLSSQGYLKLHPKRKALEAEIRNLQTLQEERLKALQEQVGEQGFEMAKLELESQLRSEIAKKTEELSRLRDQISVLKQYEQELAKQSDTLVTQLDVISAQRSRLEQLKQQKYVTSQAYNQAVTELEIIKRQGRADQGDIGLRITIAEAPQVPKHPLPLAHMSTIFMGLALSFAGGIGLVCVLDSLDSSVEGMSELRDIVPVPVVGEVDRMVSAEQRAADRTRVALLLVVLFVIVLSSDQIITRFFL